MMGWEHNIYFKDCNKILDVGCGYAEMMESFPEKVIGLDEDEKVISFCKERGFNVVKGSVLDIPFKDEEFDGVISSHVIEHLLPRDAIKMLFESSRVLKKGGLLMLRTPVFDSNFYKQNIDHIKPYPPECIKRLLRDYPELNLRMVKVIYDFKFPFHKVVHKVFNAVTGDKKNKLKKDASQGRGNITNLMKLTQIIAKIPFMRSGYTILLKKGCFN